MRKFKISIVGVTPYMQHRLDPEKFWGGCGCHNHTPREEDPVKIAESHSYIDENGNYFIPSEHFKQCFLKAGGYVKGWANNRRSMKKIVTRTWAIEEEKIPFRRFDKIDERSAVNPNVKAKIVIYRPVWLKWSVSFTLLIDDDNITIETIQNIIGYGGRYIGVGSYRPELTGECGRFDIEKIKEVENVPAFEMCEA